jgi:hypothetical protein
VTDHVDVRDSVTNNRVSGLTITSIDTAEHHPSSCGTVAFANPYGNPLPYRTAAAIGTDCDDALLGRWAASGIQTLPAGGGSIIVTELVDTITVEEA